MTGSPFQAYEKAWEVRASSGSESVDLLLNTFREQGVDFLERFDGDVEDAAEAQAFFVDSWTRGQSPREVRRAARKKVRRMFFSLFRGGFRFLRSGYIPAWRREPADVDLISWSPSLVEKEIAVQPLTDEDAVSFLRRAISDVRTRTEDPSEDTLDGWLDLGESANTVRVMVGPQAVASAEVSDAEWLVLQSVAAGGHRARGTLYLSRSTDRPAAMHAWFPGER